jgi:hypothetical protein
MTRKPVFIKDVQYPVRTLYFLPPRIIVEPLVDVILQADRQPSGKELSHHHSVFPPKGNYSKQVSEEKLISELFGCLCRISGKKQCAVAEYVK